MSEDRELKLARRILQRPVCWILTACVLMSIAALPLWSRFAGVSGIRMPSWLQSLLVTLGVVPTLILLASAWYVVDRHPLTLRFREKVGAIVEDTFTGAAALLFMLLALVIGVFVVGGAVGLLVFGWRALAN